MKRVWIFLALMGACLSAGAETATSTTDLSIKYLGQIFGDVPGALDGSGTGFVGGLFHIFNEGVMAVAGIWLMYTITQVLISTAVSDNPQKTLKNWAMWMRIALGFGLLVPGPSGYCMAQELMMQVVMQGVNLANKTWDYTLDYLKGGKLLISPQSHGVQGGIPTVSSDAEVQSKLSDFLGGYQYSSGTGSIQGALAYKVYNAQVCMFLSNTYNQQNASNDPIAKAGSKNHYQMIMIPPKFTGKVLNPHTGVIDFPGYGDTTPSVGDNCGSISLPSQVKGLSQDQVEQSYAAIAQSAIDVEPYAKQMAAYISSGQNSNLQPAVSSGGHYLFTSVLDYLKLMTPVATSIKNASKVGDESGHSFIEQAKKEGWFNAGAFYWDMVRLNNDIANKYGEGNPAKLVPTVVGGTENLPKSITMDLASAGSYLTATGDGSSSPWSAAQNSMVEYSTGKTSNGLGKQNAGTHVVMVVDMGIITGPMTTLLATLNSELSSMDATNPMLVSYNVGKSALGAAGCMWAIMIPILTVLSTAAGICDSVSPGNVIFKGLISWLQPMVIVSSGFLITTGVMLTFYVPLYPYLLFLFGVVGWLLYVIEAMVAAPLVAFGMSHPEGHDFLGRAEQALMLALGVFLRPTLMIIGYLIGMIMVYVTSSFLNLVLGQVFYSTYAQQYSANVGNGYVGMWDVLTGTTNDPTSQWVHGHFTGNMISDAILVPVVLTVYAMIMIEVVNQCFSAIHQVPDMVLRWIGGPVQQDQSAQHVQAIKGAVSSAGSQASQAMSDVGRGAQGIGQFAGGAIGGAIKGGSQGSGDDTPSPNPEGVGGQVGGAKGGDASAAAAAA